MNKKLTKKEDEELPEIERMIPEIIIADTNYPEGGQE